MFSSASVATVRKGALGVLAEVVVIVVAARDGKHVVDGTKGLIWQKGPLLLLYVGGAKVHAWAVISIMAFLKTFEALLLWRGGVLMGRTTNKLIECIVIYL